ARAVAVVGPLPPRGTAPTVRRHLPGPAALARCATNVCPPGPVVAARRAVQPSLPRAGRRAGEVAGGVRCDGGADRPRQGLANSLCRPTNPLGARENHSLGRSGPRWAGAQSATLLRGSVPIFCPSALSTWSIWPFTCTTCTAAAKESQVSIPGQAIAVIVMSFSATRPPSATQLPLSVLHPSFPLYLPVSANHS